MTVLTDAFQDADLEFPKKALGLQGDGRYDVEKVLGPDQLL